MTLGFITRVHWVSARNEHGWGLTRCGTSLRWDEEEQSYRLAFGGKVAASEVLEGVDCGVCRNGAKWKWREE